MIEIFIQGQRYEIPEGLTILRAYEWSGFRLTRGVGCRGGFCGACATVYRRLGAYQLHYALACQTVAEPGMVLGPIPFFPAGRADYHLDEVAAAGMGLATQYPEIWRCFGCNTCSKACPQDIDVMAYMAAAIQGEVAEVAARSFDCIMCGLCTARCPAELSPPAVALLARRLYGRCLAPPAGHLQQRLAEIENGGCRADLDALRRLPPDELKARYEARVIEA